MKSDSSPCLFSAIVLAKSAILARLEATLASASLVAFILSSTWNETLSLRVFFSLSNAQAEMLVFLLKNVPSLVFSSIWPGSPAFY